MRVGDTSTLSQRQRFGFWLVHALAWLQAWVYVRIIQDQVWRSADGRCTPVRQMTNSHLYNAWCMVRRNGGGPWQRILRREMNRRADDSGVK
jgi:hypothetical protein